MIPFLINLHLKVTVNVEELVNISELMESLATFLGLAAGDVYYVQGSIVSGNDEASENEVGLKFLFQLSVVNKEALSTSSKLEKDENFFISSEENNDICDENAYTSTHIAATQLKSKITSDSFVNDWVMFAQNQGTSNEHMTTMIQSGEVLKAYVESTFTAPNPNNGVSSSPAPQSLFSSRLKYYLTPIVFISLVAVSTIYILRQRALRSQNLGVRMINRYSDNELSFSEESGGRSPGPNVVYAEVDQYNEEAEFV